MSHARLRAFCRGFMAQAALLLAAGAASAAADMEYSVPAARLVHWALSSGDHGGRPFLVVDKQNARVHLLKADGTLQGSAPVLLGAARGDHTVPGIGDRPLALIQPHERTTPAGRFEGEMGRNLAGEDVLWVDYHAGVSLHRLRTAQAAQRRARRLESPTSTDNRISLGCINVPAHFFDRMLVPTIGSRAVVYVLPETLPLEQVFPLVPAGSPRPPALRPQPPRGPLPHG